MKRLLMAAALLCAVAPLWGQGVRYDGRVTSASSLGPSGAQVPILAVTNATVTICATSPCGIPSLIYSNAALTVITANPIRTDSQGRFGFWAASGNYFYSATDANGNPLGTFPISLGGTGTAGLTALTGDVLASGAGSASATLATVNPNPGACGDATHVSQVMVDAKGRTVSCTPVPITASGSTPAAPAYAVQLANVTATALASDPAFTINPTNHTFTGQVVLGQTTNGVQDADLNGGASTAITSCAGANCSVHISALSTDGENIFGLPTAAPFHLFDERKGVGTDYYVNPVQTGLSGFQQAYGHSTNCLWNNDGLSLPVERDCERRNLVEGGSGMNSANTNQISQFTNDVGSWLSGGIKQAYGLTAYVIRSGDFAGQYWYINFRDATLEFNDEGMKGSGLIMRQLPPPVGTVTSVSGASHTTVTTNLANIGQGFILVEENDVFSHGNITATTPSPGGYALPSITTSDTHAVSTWQATLSATCGSYVTPNAPVTAKCGVTGATGTFNPALKVCVGDYTGPETSNIALDTDGVSYDIGMTQVHPAGVPLAQGGACGKVIVLGNGQSTLAALHSYPNFYTSYWTVASPTSTTMTYIVQYKEGQNGLLQLSVPYVGTQGNAPVTRDGSGNATLTPVGGSGAQYPLPDFFAWNTYTAPPNAQITLSACADATFNQTVSSTSADELGIHFPLTGAAGSTTGCTLAVSGLNNYWAVGGAMTTGMPNVTMDANGNANAHGVMQVMPNDLTWNAGDTVIQANAYSNGPSISYEGISNDTPPIAGANIGKLVSLTGRGSSSESFFTLQGDQTARYLGMGPNGFIQPHSILNSSDVFGSMFNLTQPALGGQIFTMNCRLCTIKDTGYDLFYLNGLVPNRIHFEPSTGVISFPYNGVTIGGQYICLANGTSCPTAAGGVTHTASALTAKAVVIGNGGSDATIDPNVTTDGSGNITSKSLTTTGTTQGGIALGVGTGTLPTPSTPYFAGIIGPASGTPAYYLQLPNIEPSAASPVLNCAQPTVVNGSRVSVCSWGSGGSGTPSLPTPPGNATTFSSLEVNTGYGGTWGPVNTTQTGSTGAGTGNLTYGVTSPSGTTNTMHFNCTPTTAQLNCLAYRHIQPSQVTGGSTTGLSNFETDFYAELTGPLSNYTAPEFDPDLFTGTNRLLMSRQCRFIGTNNYNWFFWDTANNQWVNSGSACTTTTFAPGVKHHIQTYDTFNQSANSYTYVLFLLDGVVVWNNPSGATFYGLGDSSPNELNIQQQLDGGPTSTASMDEYLSGYKFVVW